MPAKRTSLTCFRPVYPTPAALVTSVSADGVPNIISLGEVFNLSIQQPVIVGLAIHPTRYSYQLIRECGEFVVNFPTAAMTDAVWACGSCSGRQEDKFAVAGLTALPARFVRPPLIEECPINLECRLLDVVRIGDHDLFTGEVLAHHADESVCFPDGSVDTGKLDAFAFVLGEFRAVRDRL